MRRQQRLQRREDFSAAYQEGRSYARKTLALRALRRAQPGPARFGFAVGKRLGSAVVRNRIKRRLRAIARERGAADQMDFVVIARRGAQNASFGQLGATLTELLARAEEERLPREEEDGAGR